MKWRFEQNQQQTELLVTIAKNQHDKEVMDVIACLETFGQKGSSILPIKTDDRLILLALTDVILIGGMTIYNGWVDLASFFNSIVRFLITYFIIWGILFAYSLVKAKKINQHLQERLDKPANLR